MINKKRVVLSVLCLMLLVFSVFSFSACKNEVENFNLSFKVNGETYQTITTSGDEAIAIPENPTKEGYTFDGWYWDKDVWSKPFTANSLLDAPISSDMSVYAKFSAIEYDITYENDGGTHNNPLSYTIEDGFALSAAEKLGYTFVGWYPDNTYTTKVESISVGTTGVLSLYAKFEINNYTILYENTKDVQNTNVTSYNVNTDTIALSDLSKTGYTFEGWYNGEQRVTEIAKGSTGNITLTARWSVEGYKIIYHNMTGVTNSNPTSYDVENQPLPLVDVSKTGYSFHGWYTDAKFTNEVSEIAVGTTGDIDLYAKWVANTYTVALNNSEPEYGSINGAGEYAFDSSATVRATETTGYNFLGWYDENDQIVSENKTYTFTIKGDITLTAKWNYYTITTISDNEIAGSVKKYSAVKTTPGNNVYLTATTNSGYTFKGWYLGDDLISTNTSFNVVMPKKNVEYTAKWIACPVSINVNDTSAGYVSGMDDTTHIGQEITVTAISNKGYTFLGWFAENEKLTDNPSYTFVIEEETVVYTAKWATYIATFQSSGGGYVPATVSFDLNGGSGIAPDPQLITPVDSLVYPEIPTRDGYVFRGWFTDQACTTLFDINESIQESTVLYAGWYQIAGTAINAYSGRYSCSFRDFTNQIDGGSAYQKWKKENPNHGRFYFSVLTDGYYTIDFSSTAGGYRQRIDIVCYKYGLDGQRTSYTSYSNIKANAGDVFCLQITQKSSWAGTAAYIYFDVTGEKFPKANCFSIANYSENKVTAGESVTVTTTAQEGYAFLGWFNGITRVSGEFDYTFTMPAENITITSKWCRFVIDRNDERSGEVFSSQETYDIGDEVTITAVTNKGYVFIGWYNGSEKVTDNLSYTFTVTGESIAYTAHWIECPVKVEGNSTVAGTITSLDGAYKLGDEVTITATTKEGYYWLGWFVGDEKITEELSYTFIMSTEEVTYVATWYTDILYTDSDGQEKRYTGAEIEYLQSVEEMSLSGWYLFLGVATGEVDLTVSGEANIILADGCDWTVNNIFVAEGNTLNIYSQSSDTTMGKLTVLNNLGGKNGSEGYRGSQGANNVLVGHPGGNGGNGGKGSNSGTISISGGFITVTNLGGGNGGTGGSGGSGGNATGTGSETTYGGVGGNGGIGGNGGNNTTLLIYGGHITAVRIGGGTGGQGGYSGGGGSGKRWGSAGIAGDGGNGGSGGIIVIQGGTIHVEHIGLGSAGKAGNSSASSGLNGDKAKVFYYGNENEWETLKISENNIIVHYYSEKMPNTDGNYWHYDENRNPIVWGSFYISFDLNGADGTAPATQLVTSEIGLTYPSIPTRNNYVFRGWFIESSCQNVYDFTAPISSDLTLYAGWQYVGVSVNTTQYSSFNAIDHNTYSTARTVSVNATNVRYDYFATLTSGQYKIYYWHEQSVAEEYGIYIYIRNVTTGEVILDTICRSGSTIPISFYADAGDVIYIKTNRVTTKYYSDCSYYVAGAKEPADGGTAMKLSELSEIITID